MNLLVDASGHADAILVLEDGSTFHGRSCGACGEAIGPIAVERGIFAYQEALGSKENEGALIVFTYPQLGNFGINDDAADHAAAAGAVVHDMVYTPSNWRSKKNLPDYLADQDIVGIEDIDVRALAAHLRRTGAQLAAISTQTLDPAALLARIAEKRGGGLDA